MTKKKPMGKRAKAKQLTRQKILDSAKRAFIEHGFMALSTADVARDAGVAHGTVFFHFESKEALLTEMLQRELLTITDMLYRRLYGSDDVEEMLVTYLDSLQDQELFFSTLARETPFYSPELRRAVLGYEAASRSYFCSALKREIDAGRCKDVNITTAIGILFGALNYYLSMRDSFSDGNSVIADKKQTIIETFMALIRKDVYHE